MRTHFFLAVALVGCGSAIVPPSSPTERYRTGLVLVIDDGARTMSTGAVFKPRPVPVDLDGYAPDGTCQEGAHDITLRSVGTVPEMQDVGESMLVESGGVSLPVARSLAGATAYASTHPLPLPGDVARVRWPSASPPLDAELIHLPVAPDGMPPRVGAVDGEPLELTWRPAGGDLMLVSFDTRSGTPITCAFADLGRGIVPAELVAKLFGTTRVHFTRFLRHEAEWHQTPHQRNGAAIPAYDVIGVGARSVSRPFGVATKRLFVSRRTVDGAFAAGQPSALARADALCQESATAAALGGTWHAWLAAPFGDPLLNVRGDGPWYLVDGTTLVGDRATFLDDGRRVATDELGATVAGRVWRGGVLHCSDWTSRASEGLARRIGSDGDYADAVSCGTEAHLLCLEE
jgi:hypothetical protein